MSVEKDTNSITVRTLVTTAYECTWPENKKEPILFLGEWCRRYSREERWIKLDAEVASYHWDNREKLYADYLYLQDLYESLLAELSHKLNQIHSVEYSLHYWRILIGLWLGYFIQMLFDRWCMLGQVIERGEVNACTILERAPLSIVPNDMEHFNKLFQEDDWNEAIYGQLLEKYWSKSITIRKTRPPYKRKGQYISAIRGYMLGLQRRLKRLFIGLITRSNEYFFISSYLPLTMDFRLQIRLGQIPKRWRPQPAPVVAPIQHKREWHLGDVKRDLSSFEDVVRKMIPQHIPTVYLEGYQVLCERADHLPWPANPKAIFTSNAFSASDLFKVWAAGKVESGVPLVIGQHGGNLGMAKFSFDETHQIKIADKWISWGWSDQFRPEIIPIGNLKCFGQNEVTYDPNGNALMVEMAIPRYSYHLFAIPVSRQWLDYFNDQKIFLQALPSALREHILLRPYSHDYGWDQNMRWQDQSAIIRIDSGHQDIRKIINKSRLYISTYNATTYLESMTWNIPTIMFWNVQYFEVNRNVIPYFDLLKSVGIFHETPESAAKQTVKIWNDVASWWESSSVQEARSLFCKQFANIPKDPLEDLEQLFKYHLT